MLSNQRRLLEQITMCANDNRTEELLEVQAIARLRQSPYLALHRVACKLRGDALILTGRVPNFFQKQMAQHHLLDLLECAGTLDNRLEADFLEHPK